jgi:hypothetical protein
MVIMHSPGYRVYFVEQAVCFIGYARLPGILGISVMKYWGVIYDLLLTRFHYNSLCSINPEQDYVSDAGLIVSRGHLTLILAGR